MNDDKEPFNPPELKDLHPIAFYAMALTIVILGSGGIMGFLWLLTH